MNWADVLKAVIPPIVASPMSGDEIEQALRWPAGTWDIIRKPTT